MSVPERLTDGEDISLSVVRRQVRYPHVPDRNPDARGPADQQGVDPPFSRRGHRVCSLGGAGELTYGGRR